MRQCLDRMVGGARHSECQYMLVPLIIISRNLHMACSSEPFPTTLILPMYTLGIQASRQPFCQIIPKETFSIPKSILGLC